MYRFFVVFFVLFPMLANAEVASKNYVDEGIANQVRTVGNQEIAGTKTYTESPVVPTPPLPEVAATES